ncbi:helix-turn-helix domain-containing protein [Neisseria gonorrhoeae]|uniref:helix-turn-helix domain-containing protein n=1 Tax=Neisseria gonorrhoeae TaxID=485 RepID=UPI001FD704B6|nr:helix-turn-helix domain-containing protein [Neisseria gonorrhoeae]
MAFKTGIPRGQRFVLVKLCDCANDEGLCYPSQETLAEDTGFAETAVRQHIKWLKDNNFIKSARRQRGRVIPLNCREAVQVTAKGDYESKTNAMQTNCRLHP